jgi:hypothetical protein
MIFMIALSAFSLILGALISGEFLNSHFFASVDKVVLFLVSFAYGLSLSAFGLLIVALFSRELYLSLAQGIILYCIKSPGFVFAAICFGNMFVFSGAISSSVPDEVPVWLQLSHLPHENLAHLRRSAGTDNASTESSAPLLT